MCKEKERSERTHNHQALKKRWDRSTLLQSTRTGINTINRWEWLLPCVLNHYTSINFEPTRIQYWIRQTVCDSPQYRRICSTKANHRFVCTSGAKTRKQYRESKHISKCCVLCGSSLDFAYFLDWSVRCQSFPFYLSSYFVSFVTFLLLFCPLFLSLAVFFSSCSFSFVVFLFLSFFSFHLSHVAIVLNARCDCVPFTKICEECLSHNRTKPEPMTSNQVDFLITVVPLCVTTDFLEWLHFVRLYLIFYFPRFHRSFRFENNAFDRISCIHRNF